MSVQVTLWAMPRHEEVQTGIWCPSCLKPSGAEQAIDLLFASGVSPRAIVIRKCLDCDAPLPKAEEPQ